MVQALNRFKASDEYQQASRESWSGGLLTFVQSSEPSAAQDESAMETLSIIEEARRNHVNLWDVCERLGFYSPKTIEALNRGERVEIFHKVAGE